MDSLTLASTWQRVQGGPHAWVQGCLFFWHRKCKKSVSSLRLPISTSVCAGVFFMFGTSYVDAVNGRKLLTRPVVDGLMDVQEPSVAGAFGIYSLQFGEAIHSH